MNTLIQALLDGLKDYSIDERGDIGSWIRLVSIRGLTSITQLIFASGHLLASSQLEEYLSPEMFTTIASGVLKQGVERLDNVRHEAGQCFMTLLNAELPDVPNRERWELPANSLLRDAFQECVGSSRCRIAPSNWSGML